MKSFENNFLDKFYVWCTVDFRKVLRTISITKNISESTCGKSRCTTNLSCQLLEML